MNSLAKIIRTAKAFIASGELFDADLCLDLALQELECATGKCDHGVPDGDWCEPCNVAMKESRINPENGNGE